MAMSTFASKFWCWLWRRSPRNASQPHPTGLYNQQVYGPSSACHNRPFETYIETQSIQGFQTKVGWQESSIKTPKGKLFRTRENSALLLGCGHIARQQQAVDQQDRHIRGIAGTCYYCFKDLQKSLACGDITPFDFERLSLVCSDCGKVTLSGQLCCPKHYARLIGPDGKETYLSPEDIKKQEQNRMIAKVLGPILDLFLEEDQPTEQPKSQEQDNAKSNE